MLVKGIRCHGNITPCKTAYGNNLALTESGVNFRN